MKIILATKNQNKVKEIKKILGIKGLQLLSLPVRSSLHVVENGKTFEENSAKKALAVSKRFKMTAIADDSGLCVDALAGRPGVRSARYVAPPVTPGRLCAKLHKELKNVPAGKRKARFVCAVTLAFPDGRTKTVTGECRGSIAFEMSGAEGFGYDPVFIPAGYKKTFAQMPMAAKNLLSHRGKALKRISVIIKRLSEDGAG